jgi:glycosyltransferase involved in cell wall biosynthesis
LYQVHGGALPDEFFRGKRLLTWLLKKVLITTDAIVLLAKSEYRSYRAFVPNARIELIANAIDASALTAESLDRKQSGPLNLVYVGRLARNKGIFETVESFAQLTREGRNMRLAFVGSGPDEGMLRERVAQLNLIDKVHFAGPVFGEAKNALWRTAHVFTFPTFHREGMPYALLEAMAAGAVPVTTAVGGIPDVVTDGIHGFLVSNEQSPNLAAALRRLDDDRAALASMAEAGRERVLADFTVTRLADSFQHLYNSLTLGN